MRTLRLIALVVAVTAALVGATLPAAAATVPGPPRNVTATPGDRSALVTWEAPADDGGATINRYFVTSSPGNITRDVGGSVRSMVFSGLTNGTAYTFTVRARNVHGQGAASAPTAPVTPTVASSAPTAPTAPRNAVATAGNREAVVRWDPPSSNGGSPITSYEVTTAPGGTVTTVGGSTTTATVTGLQNGTAYTFTIRARNSVGLGPASSPTAPVTPAGLPSAPRDVRATAGDTRITVQWTAPESTGGNAILSYTVSATPGTHAVSVGASVRSATLTGLTNGTAYTIRVTAANRNGSGPAGSPPATVTPYGLPGVPRDVRATAGDRSATVQWQQPVSDNGSTITGYRVTASPGDRAVTVPGTARVATVTGLTNGTSYTFRVRAINARGTGASSVASNSVRPRAVNEVRRLAGGSRIATAIATSVDNWETIGRSGSGRLVAQAVVLTRSDQFADALAATPLAAQKVGPLLLTHPSGLDPSVRSEIQRILPSGRTIYLLGGTSALSAGTESVLRSDGYAVVRLAGRDRFETAVRVARSGLGDPAVQFLVTGLDFPDALAAGAAAARTGGSVLLTNGRSPHDTTTAYLNSLAGTRYSVGGDATEAYPSAQAIVGSDRYDTSARVARRFFPSAPEVGVASGRDFPDALSGSAHAAARNGPLLLVSDVLPSTVRSYLVERRETIAYASVYGGVNAVRDQVLSDIRSAIT